MPAVASVIANRAGVPRRPGSAMTTPRTVTVFPTGRARAAAIVKPLGDGLGAGVAEAVGVGLGLAVGVAVGVAVGTGVGVAVAAGVAVGVAAGAGRPRDRPETPRTGDSPRQRSPCCLAGRGARWRDEIAHREDTGGERCRRDDDVKRARPIVDGHGGAVGEGIRTRGDRTGHLEATTLETFDGRPVSVLNGAGIVSSPPPPPDVRFARAKRSLGETSSIDPRTTTEVLTR